MKALPYDVNSNQLEIKPNLKYFAILNQYISVSVRLGGRGSSAKEGYVEGFGKNGQWGGICDDNFDINDAHVICRMLGYPFARAALASSTAVNLYGTAPSGNKFVLDELGCTGNEASIFDCPLILFPGKLILNTEWNENCDADEIAGVQCATSKL